MTCSVCLQQFESEAPDVLTFTKKGAAKLICPHCKEIYETASFSHDPDEAEAAIHKLQCTIEANHDINILDYFAEAVPEMELRIAAIRNGSYDFALDEPDESNDIPEEYRQDPEEAAEEARLAEEAKKISPIDRVITALWIVVGIVATVSLGFTIYRVLF